MKAVEVLFPVFFMMFLGFLSRKYSWIKPEQNEGAKKIVFNILFPLLVYHVLAESKISESFVPQIIYVDALWIIIYMVGKFIVGKGGKYEKISPFLLLTCEGGNVALPLYLSMVAKSNAVNILTFDVAGILINFGLLPILVTRELSEKADIRVLLKRIILSPFMLAVIFGIVSNMTGVQGHLMNSELGSVYTSTIEMVITPITGIILFTLGYELKMEKSLLLPLLKLGIIRICGCVVIIIGFFIFFPTYMADNIFKAGVLLYFMCPTGFPVPLQIKPLVKSEDEENF
ncbi:MAG: AEC family transporter, partial [Lachnoanaerobaculum sp.]|nr:AEC family transporter [Lachnoanaerobaculum sp.]